MRCSDSSSSRTASADETWNGRIKHITYSIIYVFFFQGEFYNCCDKKRFSFFFVVVSPMILYFWNLSSFLFIFCFVNSSAFSRLPVWGERNVLLDILSSRISHMNIEGSFISFSQLYYFSRRIRHRKYIWILLELCT